MKMWKKIGHWRKILPAFSLLLILLGCQEAPPNNPPEISDLIIYPSQPQTGQMVLLTGIADDEDGDQITYKWIASGGTFIDTLGANPIQWQAPSKPDTINIFLHVTDNQATSIETKSFYLEPGLGTVAGHVSDFTTSHKISDVIINLNGTEYTTGNDGHFQFTDVTTGDNIPISATAANYVTYADFISVSVDENILDISMTILTEVGRVVGYVTDSITGLKLAGVTVQTGEVVDTTGSDGYYELYNIPLSENVPVRATLDGYDIFSNMLVVSAGYNTNNIVLNPNIATISGRITAAGNGALLNGVVVTINQHQDTTNVAGYYEIADIPVMSNASVSAVLDGYVTSHSLVDITGGINNINLTLEDNPGYLSGWVRNSLDGSVLPNITITVGSAILSTLNDGSYEISGLSTIPTLVTCEPDGFEPFTDLISIEPGQNSLNIDLVQIIGNLTGFVRDSLAGSPLAGVGIQFGEMTTTSDANGHYGFDNIEIEELALTVSEAGYLPYSITYGLEAGENVHNIQLIQSTSTVLGLVKDASTGLVLSNATVTIDETSAETDENGYFELSSIELGAKTIRCELDNYTDFSDTVTVGYGENIFNINLYSSIANLSGVVTSTITDMLLAGVIISVDGMADTTDEGGYYSISGLSLESENITTTLEGFENRTIAIDVMPGENLIDIALSPNLGTVIGYVTAASSGLALDTVSVLVVGIDTVQTDMNGYYIIENIPVGEELTLKTSLPGYADYVSLINIGAGENDISIELVQDHGWLTGYIRENVSELPLDSARIIVGTDTTYSDNTGYYHLDSLDLGTPLINIMKIGYSTYSERVTILPSENILDISLSNDMGSLIGYVRDSNTDLFLDSVMVYFEEDSVLTGVDGRYEFLDIPLILSGNLVAQKSGYLGFQQWVEIVSGDNIVDVDLNPSN